MNENLYTLLIACRLMLRVNEVHKNEIFIEPFVNREDECIEFDIMNSNLEHATQLCSLLNLTLSIEPDGDKLKYQIL